MAVAASSRRGTRASAGLVQVEHVERVHGGQPTRHRRPQALGGIHPCAGAAARVRDVGSSRSCTVRDARRPHEPSSQIRSPPPSRRPRPPSGWLRYPRQAGGQDAAAAAAARTQTVQLLSFNDFHGHLEATDPPLSRTLDPSQTLVGGAEYLAPTLDALRAQAGDQNSLTVAAGDLIGGSPFLSGVFHDEPAVESLEAMGLDVSSVGNHEFDEGTDELLRMQNGGCHPVDGCYFPEDPYDGADFDWLAANVVRSDNGRTLLPSDEGRDAWAASRSASSA